MKKVIAFCFLMLYSSFLFACSTFLLNKNGHLVFGRNYDWITGNGAVVINARGVKKTSFTPEGEKAISWVAGCGSITFNQYGKEFPHGGMNERGLVIELMWLSETTYPHADQRAALNELQWIQYQLDNCTTVNEVIATDSLLRISREGAAPLHYLVADATGDAATIEFINGRMQVHKGKDLPNPVLTNTIYEDALQQANTKKYRFRDNSVERFATACNMVKQFQNTPSNQLPVDYAFTILDKIAQGRYTKWRIVYDITQRQIHFVTSDQQQRKSIGFTDFDFNCSTAMLYFNLNNSGAGAIANTFKTLNFEENQALLRKSAAESKSQITIPAIAIEQASHYFNTVQCSRE